MNSGRGFLITAGLCGLASIAAALLTHKLPLHLPFLQSNMDGNSFSLTNLNRLSAAGMTNLGFSTSGVVTNDAGGKLYTTPTLQNALLDNSSITVQGVPVSLGGSTLGVGSSPQFNGQQITNVLAVSVSSPTNGIASANAVDFSVHEATTNIVGAVSFTSLLNLNPTNYNEAIRWCVNRSGSDQTITTGAWETDSERLTATTYISTNNTTLKLTIGCQVGVFTNVIAKKTFR